jgi:hypothetical protein
MPTDSSPHQIDITLVVNTKDVTQAPRHQNYGAISGASYRLWQPSPLTPDRHSREETTTETCASLILSSLIYVPLSHIHTGCGLKNYLLVEAHEFLQKEVTQRKFLLPKQPFFHTPHRK